MPVQITTTKELVRRYLQRFPELRDNDNRLLANVWSKEVKALGIQSAEFLLKALADGKLTNPESIRRSRQQLQEQHPELRGELYKEKQAKQITVQKELGYGAT